MSFVLKTVKFYPNPFFTSEHFLLEETVHIDLHPLSFLRISYFPGRMDYFLFFSLVAMTCVMSGQARSEGKIISLFLNSL